VDFIQKNVWLVMVAVASGVLFIWPTIAKLFSRIKEVGVTAAVQLINRQDAAVVDVREPNEYKAGHIPNARNIPLGQFENRSKDLEKLKSKPILVVCQSGGRSTQAGAKLQKQGYNIVALAGGMAAWQQASMPVEKD
jgi:rhodanese-related sulfurtransferase